MDKPAYQIKQLILATEAVSQARAQVYEAHLKTNLTRILASIEEALGAFDQTTDMYCIPRLEINLGRLSRLLSHQEWTTLFTQHLQKSVQKLWREQRYTHLPAEPNIQAWRLFDYFIRQGRWPWWHSATRSLQLSVLWEKIWPRYADKLIQLFRDSAQQDYWLQRFIYSLTDQQLSLLLQAIHQDSTFNLADFYQQLTILSNQLSAKWQLPKIAMREAYWQLCFQHLVIRPLATFRQERLLADYLNYLAINLQQSFSLLLEEYLQVALPTQFLRTTSSTHTVISTLQRLVATSLPSSITFSIGLLIQDLLYLLDGIHTNAQPAVYITQLQGFNQRLRFLQQQSLTPVLKEHLQNLQQATQHLLSCLQQALSSDQVDQAITASVENTWIAAKSCQNLVMPSNNTNLTILKRQESVESYLISYAGVILLHPFLPFLFKHCRLLKNQSFSQPRALQRALLLIHFLATGKTIPHDTDLTLAKLFCGLPIDAPLVITEKLTSKNIQQAKALLAVIRERWTILKNSTDDGLRHAFLMRSGILKRETGLWCLRLENQGCDALLDKLPWALTPVKSSWMHEHLVVEWR